MIMPRSPRSHQESGMRRIHGLSLAVLCGVLLAATFWLGSPAAQTALAWPSRTVRFILTLGPGSGTDIGGRLLADRLSKRWGQSVVIENRPGGDGIVGITAFVGAK